MINKKEKIDYWLDLAKYDLKTADVMLNNKRFLYVGFMCHQVIEKTLKGYFIFKINKIPPYIHNLSLLAEQSKIENDLSEKQKKLIDELDPLNIEARYPTYKDKVLKSLNIKRCTKLLTYKKEFFKWIKKKLSK